MNTEPTTETVGRAWDMEYVAAVARHIGAVGLAGLVSGLVVGGIGSRVFMRLSAAAAPDRVDGLLTEAGNRIGEITAGGTIGLIVFVGIPVGGVAAALYVVAEPWLGWAGRAKGLAFGLLLLAMGSTGSIQPENADFFIVANPVLNVTMLATLHVGMGVSVWWLAGLFARRLPPVDPARPATSAAPYLPLIALGTLFIPLIFLSLLGSDGCTCPRAAVIAGAAVVMGVATAGLWLIRAIEAPRRANPVIAVAGYAGLVAAYAAGSLQAIADITAIV